MTAVGQADSFLLNEILLLDRMLLLDQVCECRMLIRSICHHQRLHAS
jgi:hypothetical protein